MLATQGPIVAVTKCLFLQRFLSDLGPESERSNLNCTQWWRAACARACADGRARVRARTDSPVSIIRADACTRRGRG